MNIVTQRSAMTPHTPTVRLEMFGRSDNVSLPEHGFANDANGLVQMFGCSAAKGTPGQASPSAATGIIFFFSNLDRTTEHSESKRYTTAAFGVRPPVRSTAKGRTFGDCPNSDRALWLVAGHPQRQVFCSAAAGLAKAGFAT
jgi:hypothetical protein